MAKKNYHDGPDGYQLFKDDLKSGQFKRVYVLHGEESYLVNSCRTALKKKLIDPLTEDFNYHRFTSENFSLEAFSEAVEAIPMMSEFTLIEITDINFFAFPEDERNFMAEIFSDVPDYCTILFVYDAVEWKPDKRVKLYTALKGIVSEIELNKQSERELIPWIRRTVGAYKKVMQDDLCRYLINQTGGSMTVMAAELEKLVHFTDQTEITRYDIDQVVIPVLEAAIFDITRAIGDKDFDSALLKLKDLLRQDTEPIVINAVIGKQLRQMYLAKILAEHGKDAYELTQLYGIRDFAAKQVYQQARGFKKPQLKEGCRICAQVDYDMKTSGGNGEDLLETALLQIAQLGGRS